MCVSEGFNITWLGAVRKGLHEDRALELGAKGLAGAHGVKAGVGGACPKKREQAMQRPCAHVGKPVRGGGWPRAGGSDETRAPSCRAWKVPVGF